MTNIYDQINDARSAITGEDDQGAADKLADIARNLAKMAGDLNRTLAEALSDTPVADEVDQEPPPETHYGVRLTFADETGTDIDNVESVQVYDKRDTTFPFGFMPVLDEDGETETHRPVWWSPEDGQMHPFSKAEAPKPFDAFGA